MNDMGKPPCLKCPDRSAECHAVCEKYGEWAKENARLREERNKKISMACALYETKKRSIDKALRDARKLGKRK